MSLRSRVLVIFFSLLVIYTFANLSFAQSPAKCEPLDPSTLKLNESKDLTAKGLEYSLLSIYDEKSADDFIKIAKTYGLNQFCYASKADEQYQFPFFLVTGKAPKCPLSNKMWMCLKFDPAKIQFTAPDEKQQGWSIVIAAKLIDSNEVELADSVKIMGYPKKEEAITRLEILKKYEFSYYCNIGANEDFWCR